GAGGAGGLKPARPPIQFLLWVESRHSASFNAADLRRRPDWRTISLGQLLMASLFLSYARDDVRRAERVAQALESAGHDVWWDREVHAGSRFSAEIDRALKAADLIIVLWSRSSIDSAWVHDEAAVGRDSGRLVPVMIEPTKPPLGFRQYQTVDLSVRSRSAQPLLTAISEKL